VHEVTDEYTERKKGYERKEKRREKANSKRQGINFKENRAEV
jgi:hypothetical protein